MFNSFIAPMIDMREPEEKTSYERWLDYVVY